MSPRGAVPVGFHLRLNPHPLHKRERLRKGSNELRCTGYIAQHWF